MTDSPFTPFTPTAPPPNGGPFAPAPEGEAAPAVKPRRGPKPGFKRGPNKPQAAPPAEGPGVRVDLNAAVAAISSLKTDDLHLYTQVAAAIGALRPDARERILSALGKVFA